MTQPRVIILAGPNGAGKTTFAREFLPREAGCLLFINADLIAAGLSPFAPERAAIRAGRLMLQAIDQHLANRESFAFETTLSGLSYAKQIPRWRKSGYRVELIFLSLPSADMAVQRVAQRVNQGGHDISEDIIRRRFEAGRRLFTTIYQSLVDRWVLYDNAAEEPALIAWSDNAMPGASDTNEPQPPYGEFPADADADLQGSLAALRRVAQRARQLAQQTGTDLIVVRNGRVVRIRPQDQRQP